MSVTNSFSAARWILQLTLTKHVYSVTNVHFRYAKGVVLWKLNYEPKLILSWFAYRSYNPISLFHLVEKHTEVVMLPPRNTCRGLLFPDLENWKGELSLHWRPWHVRIFGEKVTSMWQQLVVWILIQSNCTGIHASTGVLSFSRSLSRLSKSQGPSVDMLTSWANMCRVLPACDEFGALALIF